MKKGDILFIQEHSDEWLRMLSWGRVANEVFEKIEFNAAIPKLMISVEEKKEDYVRNDFDKFHNIILSIQNFSDSEMINLKELMRIKKNLVMRKYRYKKILRTWLDSGSQVVFLTLTFNDEFLNQGFDKCRQNINYWLNYYCSDSMANDDYGKENGRLHYHAICILRDSNILKKTIIDAFNIQHYNIPEYPFGYIDVQMVIRSDSDNVTRYFNKIINHSLKQTAASEQGIKSQE